MLHHLQHIADLVEICRLKGIQHIVVSPGSRNAPLLGIFASNPYFSLHSIVDERSAGFYALGIALAKQQAVALLCTSGTAVLNYGPALAEAYYQRVPLVAITADRPEELIDQQDNQTIRQINVFQNYVKDSIHLHQPLLDAFELSNQHFAINKIINQASSGIKGPIHINVPIAEPLYVEIPACSEKIIIYEPEMIEKNSTKALSEAWAKARRKLIVCGEATPNASINNLVVRLAAQPGVVVLAEPISNIQHPNIVAEIDRTMMLVETLPLRDFEPALLISFGGPVVSKRLKQWLQKQTDLSHFRLSEDEDRIDTYQNLNATIIGNTANLLELLLKTETVTDHHFGQQWKTLQQTSTQRHNSCVAEAPFSDLKATALVLENALPQTILHLGNSTPVRYGQLFNLSKFTAVYANRGVSGIDGCVSTAAGVASQSQQTNLLVVGDLSFVYDSNGLWNKKLKSNFKIVVINNNGGGIFRLLPGSGQTTGFDEFIETQHPVCIEKIAKAFGVEYFSCSNEQTFQPEFNAFISWDKSAALIEIFTPQTENALVYKNYIEKIKFGGE
jgi:2-succinyl-5-enolpyruvyl-6-hydroxy-3-cyclohexene-1-carboxylate synthase